MGADFGDVGKPYAPTVAERFPAAHYVLAEANPTAVGTWGGRSVRLATASGEMSITVPAGARATRAAVHFRFDRAVAGVTADVTIFSDACTAADDPAGALRALLLFWRDTAPAEIGAALAGVSPGSAVDISGRFIATEQRWRLGYPGAASGPGEDSPPPPERVAFLVRPKPDWPFGPVLIFGEGRVRHRLAPRPEGLAADVYEAETGPAAPNFAGRFVEHPLYFSVRPGAGAAASPQAREAFVAALAAALIRILPPAGDRARNSLKKDNRE